MKQLILSFPRLGLQLRNDLLKFYRPILLTSGVFIGFILLVYMVQVQDVIDHGTVPPFHTEWFGTILMIAGFVFSSFAFYELNQKEKGMRYLLDPASQLEKWLSRFIITSGGFALYFWLLYGLTAVICDAVARGIWGASLQPFDMIGDNTLLLLRLYLVLQSLFIAGSIFLGRLSFLTTPLTLGIIAAAFLLLATITIKLLIWNISEGWDLSPMQNFHSTAEWDLLMQHTIIPIIQQLFWWTLAPFFWVVSFVRLTEKER